MGLFPQLYHSLYVNGADIQIPGQQQVTHIIHMAVTNITFLITPIIGLDVFHQNNVQLHVFQIGKTYRQQDHERADLHYFKDHENVSGRM